MGCDVVVGGADDDAFAAIVRLFEGRDRRFSRFRDDSELCRVNASSGDVVAVSEEFARVTHEALRAAGSTSGLVDPTVGASLEALGYDRDFDSLEPSPLPPSSVLPTGWRAVRVAGRFIARPAGTALDVNGVVKGLTVDDAVALLPGDGFVSAGGDIGTRGSVVVGLPDGEAVVVEAGGIATSGSATRRWVRGGILQHHLVDPRTGACAASPWLYVTAIGRTCLAADVAAKAGFLCGHDGPEWLDERGVAGRFVTADGVIVANSSWNRSLALEAACS